MRLFNLQKAPQLKPSVAALRGVQEPPLPNMNLRDAKHAYEIRTRREFLAMGAGGLAVLALGNMMVWGAPLDEATSPPNLVLCMTDDQGWGDVSYNGLKACKTPCLDAMAAAGLRLDRFYAAAPVCSPTRGSFLTGRHPYRYGIFRPSLPLRIEEQTIAQAAKQAGYATGHFGKWHLNGVDNSGKVIAANDPLHPGRFGFDEWLSAPNYFDLNWTLSRQGQPERFTGDGSDYIAGEAIKFMDRARKQGKPFLAVVWFGNPHEPHRALEEDTAAAGGSAYYGEIVAIDRAMGTLREALRRSGIADNTLLLFCSDNGPSTRSAQGSTGSLRGRKTTLWEGGVRVPGIIEWPARIQAGSRSSVPVCTSDIYPTIVEMLGVTMPGQNLPLDGISLLPLVDGRMTERGKGIGFWHSSTTPQSPRERSGGVPFDEVVDTEKVGGQMTWTEDRYKLYRMADGKYELYDLSADLAESRDLAAERPETVERMKAELGAWHQSVLRSLRREDYLRD
ncbi:MAG: N-acetylgalactosamine 6-sulfate sulfatase [Lentisphaerae bacterium]|nr:N-acetylgalactosamine 6-sulfate sulfatase [Lentisphaerota bacterium]